MAPSRAFYEGVLGLTPTTEGPDGSVIYAAGSGALLVYPSSFAGSNKATAMTFQVPKERFDAEVAALREKDVTFQTFDMEGVTWADGVASYQGAFSAVWFTDPDGNIINVATEMPG
jgi:catechol 2,3-dioxygenase-like lactoylglutathione lyase family enzyme